MNIKEYARKIGRWAYKNSETVGAIAATVIVPSISYATGDIGAGVAIGMGPLAIGNIYKVCYIFDNERMDAGTIIKMVSTAPRIIVPLYMMAKSLDPNLPDGSEYGLTDALTLGASYATGFAGEMIGNAVKGAKSARWNAANKINDILKKDGKPLSEIELNELGEIISHIKE